MAPFDLATHRQCVEQQILPCYKQLGSIAFAYMQGSLVAGYTDESDLDVIIVWDQLQVPTNRDSIVSQLDEQKRHTPFVIDYQDVHLECFEIAQQEYNVGHWALSYFQNTVQAVLDGQGFSTQQVLNPLTAVSGFYYGKLLLDTTNNGQQLKEVLSSFPDSLKSESKRILRARQQSYYSDLHKFAEREDWFMFHSVLIAATRTVMQALFSTHQVYYPGDKWLRHSIIRFGLDPQILSAFECLWIDRSDPGNRIAALSQLITLSSKDS